MSIKRNKKIVCVSGYFDPIGIHHLDLFRRAKEFGTDLVVIVNNDNQLRKKLEKNGWKYLTVDPLIRYSNPPGIYWERERLEIIRSIRDVDYAILAVDQDDTVCKTLELIRPHYFVNGGDVKDKDSCRESDTCKRFNIEQVFLPGGKTGSSSEIKNRFLSHALSPESSCT